MTLVMKFTCSQFLSVPPEKNKKSPKRKKNRRGGGGRGRVLMATKLCVTEDKEQTMTTINDFTPRLFPPKQTFTPFLSDFYPVVQGLDPADSRGFWVKAEVGTHQPVLHRNLGIYIGSLC